MTLLNSRLNTSLRNYGFSKKLNGEGRKKGIRDYSDLSITKQDIVIPYENGSRTIWDEVAITERTEKIWNEIIQIW